MLAGWFSPAALALGVYPAMFILGVAVCGSLQAAVLHVAANHGPVNFVDTGSSPFVQQVRDLSVWYMVLLGFVLAYAGSILGVLGRRHAVSRTGLQNALAARAPRVAGGPSECRICGAPLAPEPGELGVACQYCRADNLLIPAPPLLKAFSADTLRLASATQSAQQAEATEQARMRGEVWRYVFWLSVLTPIVALMFRGEIGSEPVFPTTLEDWPPNYALFRQGPTPLIAEHVMAWGLHSGPFEFPRGRRWPARAKCAPGDRLIETTLASVLCGVDSCEFVYYVPLARGDAFAFVANDVPESASLRIEHHTTDTWRADDKGKTKVSFGPTAFEGPVQPGQRVELRPSFDAWHRLTLSVPFLLSGDQIVHSNEPRTIAFCVEITR